MSDKDPEFTDEELKEIEEVIIEMPQEELVEALKKIKEKQKREIQ